MKSLTLISLIFLYSSSESFSQTKVNFYDSLNSFINSRFINPSRTVVVLQEQGLDPLSIYGIDTNRFSDYFIKYCALIFEFSDSTTTSWQLVEGFSSDTDKDTLLISKPLLINSPFKQIANTESFMDSIKSKSMHESIIAYYAKSDTTYIVDKILHDSNFEVSIYKNGKQVYRYNFKNSWIKKRNLPEAFTNYSDNLNYPHNLKTMQYKLFKWMEYYFLNRNTNYIY